VKWRNPEPGKLAKNMETWKIGEKQGRNSKLAT
jgi:hypothetical protein